MENDEDVYEIMRVEIQRLHRVCWDYAEEIKLLKEKIKRLEEKDVA